MKKIAVLLLMIMLLPGCAETEQPVTEFDTPQAVIDFMLDENAEYVPADTNGGEVSGELRVDTAENGQHPYAVVITCSDSRVPPEHIFNAGLSELFVIRTAGNVIGDYELGSIEYGADHLHTKLIMVLGHTQCGAVDAALNGGAHGYVQTITDEIISCLPENCDARTAEILNVENSIECIRESEIICELEAKGELEIVGAIYDISTGKVEILDEPCLNNKK